MANITVSTAAKFIPEVWKDAILDYAEANFRIRNQVTNVSDIVSGDTVHVPRISQETAAAKSADTAVTYSAQTDGEVSISIDQHAYEAKRIEDIVRVQGSYDLFSLYAKSMGYALSKKIENHLALLIQTATANDVTLSADNTFTTALVRSGLQKLLDVNVDYTNGETHFYASPAGYMSLMSLGEFSDFQERGPEAGGGAGPNITGQLGSIYGMPVYTSVDWDDDGGTGDESASIFTKESVMFAMQMEPRVQSVYDIDHLATSVVADVLFGASLTQAVGTAAGQIVNFNNP
tara:strand:- start:1088 stop:1957 length:870 start_codon:yes stop_codon:yes gene_type:complete